MSETLIMVEDHIAKNAQDTKCKFGGNQNIKKTKCSNRPII